MSVAIRDVRTALFERMAIGGFDACWWWLGKPNAHGYGGIKIKGKTHLAHRFVYEWLRGPIPQGHLLHHRCEEPMCVNPRHLEPVTQQQHQENHDFRGNRLAAAVWRDRTHCKNGHLLSGENIRLTREGWRKCRVCDRERKRRG